MVSISACHLAKDNSRETGVQFPAGELSFCCSYFPETAHSPGGWHAWHEYVISDYIHAFCMSRKLGIVDSIGVVLGGACEVYARCQMLLLQQSRLSS